MAAYSSGRAAEEDGGIMSTVERIALAAKISAQQRAIRSPVLSTPTGGAAVPPAVAARGSSRDGKHPSPRSSSRDGVHPSSRSRGDDARPRAEQAGRLVTSARRVSQRPGETAAASNAASHGFRKAASPGTAAAPSKSPTPAASQKTPQPSSAPPPRAGDDMAKAEIASVGTTGSAHSGSLSPPGATTASPGSAPIAPSPPRSQHSRSSGRSTPDSLSPPQSGSGPRSGSSRPQAGKAGGEFVFPGRERTPSTGAAQELVFEGAEPSAPSWPEVFHVLLAAVKTPWAVLLFFASLGFIGLGTAFIALLRPISALPAVGTVSHEQQQPGNSQEALGQIHWARSPGQCVMVEGNTPLAGYSLVVLPCPDEPFAWIVPSKDKPFLRPLIAPDLCLDNPNGSDLQLWSCTTETPVVNNMQFHLHAAGNDVTRGTIRPSKNSSMCVAVPGHEQGDEKGDVLQLKPCTQSDNATQFLVMSMEQGTSSAGEPDAADEEESVSNGALRSRRETYAERIQRVAKAVKAKAVAQAAVQSSTEQKHATEVGSAQEPDILFTEAASVRARIKDDSQTRIHESDLERAQRLAAEEAGVQDIEANLAVMS